MENTIDPALDLGRFILWISRTSGFISTPSYDGNKMAYACNAFRGRGVDFQLVKRVIHLEYARPDGVTADPVDMAVYLLGHKGELHSPQGRRGWDEELGYLKGAIPFVARASYLGEPEIVDSQSAMFAMPTTGAVAMPTQMSKTIDDVVSAIRIAMEQVALQGNTPVVVAHNRKPRF